MKITSSARRFGLIAFAFGGTLPSAQNFARADDGIRTVALSARPAPGTPAGVSYLGFALPVLNDLGTTSFAAGLTGTGVDNSNLGGIWSGGPGGLTMVVRTGSTAPGTAGLAFRGVGGRLGVGVAGAHTFEGSLEGVTQYNEQGIWSDSAGTLALVARQGNHAVGTPAGIYYSHLDLGQTTVSNQAGQTAFTAFTSFNGLYWGSGLWAGSAGSLRAVALSGGQAPGTPNGSVFGTGSFGGFEGITLNDAGRTAFIAGLELGRGGVIYQVNDTGIWSEGPGGLALVARAGNPAPGTPAGVRFADTFFPLAFNNAGQTAFAVTLVGTGVNDANDTGLWSGGPGALQLVARGGSAAPGTPAGVSFGTFYGGFPVINDAGQVAILTNVTGSGVNSTNDRGIWLGDSAGLQLVVREGGQAPGTAAAVSFSGMTEPALNNAGQIAFVAILSGSGVDDTNDVGIWATDVTGALRLIVRTGDELEVGPGDLRTIDELDMVLRHGGSDGRPSAFNDLGQLAFRAGFTDGSAGIFVSGRVAVPEPGGLALPGLALLALLRRRKRAGSEEVPDHARP